MNFVNIVPHALLNINSSLQQVTATLQEYASRKKMAGMLSLACIVTLALNAGIHFSFHQTFVDQSRFTLYSVDTGLAGTGESEQ